MPSVLVAAGNRLPGVPNRAAWSELKWTHASGIYSAAELKHHGRVIANNISDESTNAVTLLGARISVQQQWGTARWSAFLRSDNLSGKPTRLGGFEAANLDESKRPFREWK